MFYLSLDVTQKIKMFYTFNFLLRRILFLVIAFWLKDFTGLQIIAQNYLNLTMFIYFGMFKPFNSKQRNFQEMLNETVI